MYSWFFFFNDTATTEIYTLSLHDALPIFLEVVAELELDRHPVRRAVPVVDHRDERLDALEVLRVLGHVRPRWHELRDERHPRSEEHTSELQSRQYLVCRLLLEKKNKHPSV